jgi:hypothetical protein
MALCIVVNRKRIGSISLVVAAAACAWGCRGTRIAPASVLNVADPLRANQLLEGFYGVEKAPARWTARAFSVLLKPPLNAGRYGSRLWLRLYLPEKHVELLGAMTLCADVDGYPLAPETYSKGGLFDFSRDVPPHVVDTNIVPVHFAFDRASPPSPADYRELGAVIAGVGLLPK